MNVLFTGGGTAGHVTPGIEIAKELQNRFPKLNIVYAGNKHFIEKKISEENNIKFTHFDSKGFEGDTLKEKFVTFARENYQGFQKAKRYLVDEDIRFIVATGGFVSFPILAAAKNLNVPYYIHEQNKVMGKVNKLFVKRAAEVYLSFEDTEIKGRMNARGKFVGNPVKINKPIEQGEDVVVLGGSGGASFLNRWAVQFAESNPDIYVHIQAGEKNKEDILRRTSGLKNVTVHGFVDIPVLLKKAKVVVSRGGTSTLFELYNAKLPTIAVPLPNAAEDHQRKNIKAFEKMTDRIMMIQQSDEEKLSAVIVDWYKSNKLKKNGNDTNEPYFGKNASKIATDIYSNYINNHTSGM